jgi:hypothetical protein
LRERAAGLAFAAVQTDALPRSGALRREHEASDARPALPLLPAAQPLVTLSRALGESLEGGEAPAVRPIGQEILDELSRCYGVSSPVLKVLGVRPHRTREGRLSYELFGDYTLETAVIRCWMRTAMRGRVTSHRGFLNTLLHEFCHHLDVHSFGFSSTPHTRGFFARIDELYHLALATPPAERRPLVWVARGRSFHIDWRALRRAR